MVRYYIVDNLKEMNLLLRKLRKVLKEIEDLHYQDMLAAIHSESITSKDRKILLELLTLKNLERDDDTPIPD
jgi:hypothetical protein